MPRLLEVREICELALRKIGSFSINDAGAQAVEIDVARQWLDLLVGHVTSKRRSWWMVPETALITLIGGQDEYPLATALPGGGQQVQHAITVLSRYRQDGRTKELPISRRSDWDARQPMEPGEPWMVYIDRDRQPILRVYPAPATPPTHDLQLTFQRFSTDLTLGSRTKPMPDFRETWNLYLVTALAYEIGNGPVRKLPADEVREMRESAEALLIDLETFDAQEQANEPRRISYNDF